MASANLRRLGNEIKAERPKVTDRHVWQEILGREKFLQAYGLSEQTLLELSELRCENQRLTDEEASFAEATMDEDFFV